jgi:4-hydroxy-3-polyprenylbenzoate decarboxylase
MLRLGGVLPDHPPRNLTVATTGASGAIFLRHLLLAVEGDSRVQTVNFIASDSALRVMAEELDITGRGNLVGQILQTRAASSKNSPAKVASSKAHTQSKIASSKIKEQSNADIGANVASGSYPAEAMIVIPCSVGTLARIANGVASNLIERAADVSLKEKRPLVLCVREAPLNKIHILNMYRAADAGATIFPLIPAFYYRPASLDETAREFAYRVLAHLGLSQPDAFRWKG